MDLHQVFSLSPVTAASERVPSRPDFSEGLSYSYDLVPRMAHSLLLHPVSCFISRSWHTTLVGMCDAQYDMVSCSFKVSRKLYVIGGQRNKQPLSDMLTFDLQSQETEILANGKNTSGTLPTALMGDIESFCLLMCILLSACCWIHYQNNFRSFPQ